MSAIHSYLTFNGNCREAMLFYKKCLGGKLTFQAVGDSPVADKMPKQMNESILHATLTNGDLMLMATDIVSENGLIKGNAVSLMLACNSEKELRVYYKKLSGGGEATQPLDTNFWGILFGNLTDKFGNHWLLHFDKNQKIE